MKTFLLVAVCLSWTTASYVQTTPASPPATTEPNGASGTKNVGADRADAPQAPGMTTPGDTRSSSLPSTQMRHAASQPRTKRAGMRKQTTLPKSPQ
jgi:hypothetical protein